jgi:hypothetical protein
VSEFEVTFVVVESVPVEVESVPAEEDAGLVVVEVVLVEEEIGLAVTSRGKEEAFHIR